ncbi:hypothetical protein [Niallia sp. Krafla_26]|uniref:hypothetical protein n=1 Tax=Niallia sp. Krafla_26 TaxID=3064703 RepID=UPI003D164C82
MKFDPSLFWQLLKMFFGLYLCLYLAYILYIYVFHISYSVVSVSAILLPAIFLLIMLVAFRKNKKMQKEYKTIRNLGIMAPILCMGILGFYEYQTTFTTEKWLNSDKEKVYMVDDLLENYTLKDMTKDELTSLLGAPIETEYFKSDNNVVYYLGDERGLISIDSEWLVIDFDSRGRVANYQVLTD